MLELSTTHNSVTSIYIKDATWGGKGNGAWDEEIEQAKRFVKCVNSLKPQPRFVVVCGGALPFFVARHTVIDPILLTSSHVACVFRSRSCTSWGAYTSCQRRHEGETDLIRESLA